MMASRRYGTLLALLASLAAASPPAVAEALADKAGEPARLQPKRGPADRSSKVLPPGLDATTGIEKGARRKRREATPASGRDFRAYLAPPWRRGFVSLESVGSKRSWQGYVLGPGDEVLPLAARRIREVLCSWRTGKSVPIDTRLLSLMAQVSDAFGGRTIRVVSGYREHSHAKNSRHKLGRAVDFSIDGVPNWALRDYLRLQRNVGVGYYPNSTFVHLDVRERPAYWVDLSRHGEAPKYVVKAKKPPVLDPG